MGRHLAALMGWNFLDTDAALSRDAGMSVAELVRLHGWDAFRELESAVLLKLSAPRAIIATGGGMVLAEANRTFMRERGMVFYLRVPAPTLAARLAADPDAELRPALTDLSPAEEAAEVLRRREPLYQATAHHVLDAAFPPRIVAAAAMAVLMRAGSASCG